MTADDTATRMARAARDILVREGADAVSMRKVAAAVGVTPMAIYRHYPNREELLRAVADTEFQALGEKWGRRATGDDLESRWRGLLQDFLDFALGTPHLYLFLMTDRRPEARRFPVDFEGYGSQPYSKVVEAIEDGMRAGLIREDDPLEVTLTITASTQGLVQLYLGGRIGLDEKEFRALCERVAWRIIDGLRPG